MRESVCQGKTKTERCQEDICANENASGTKIPKLIPELKSKIIPTIIPKLFQKLFQKAIDDLNTRQTELHERNIFLFFLFSKSEFLKNDVIEKSK